MTEGFRLLDIWDDARTSTRVVTIGLLFIGICSTALGVIGDSLSWWDHFPFLTNLASGVAGAAFGIPFALVVLQQVSLRQAEVIASRSSHRLTVAALAKIAESLTRFGDASRAQDLNDLLTACHNAHIEFEESVGPVLTITSEQGSRSAREGHASAEELAFLRDALVQRGSAYRQFLDVACQAVRDDLTVRDAWTSTSELWKFLDGAVKVRAYETGSVWLSDSDFFELRGLLSKQDSPVTSLIEFRRDKAAYYAEKAQTFSVQRVGESYQALTQEILWDQFSDYLPRTSVSDAILWLPNAADKLTEIRRQISG